MCCLLLCVLQSRSGAFLTAKNGKARHLGQSFDNSTDAVDSAIDPSLILSASTVSICNPQPVLTRLHPPNTTELLDDEGIRSLLAATTSSLSCSEEDLVAAVGIEGARSMPNVRSLSPMPISPRRQGRARTYADLRLARVAKTYSKCRAIANIRVTADRSEECRNAVKIIQIGNQVIDYFRLLES